MNIQENQTKARAISAVLIELDYKASYSRFALTVEEFQQEFPRTFQRFGPLTKANTNTLRPMVHIWFAPCLVYDELWNKFFSDMSYGLPESDIAERNYAWIDTDRCGLLRQYIAA